MLGDNDFRDPWGNHFQVVAYSRHPVHQDRPDPRGDGLGGLGKSERALARASREGPCGLASPSSARRWGSAPGSPRHDRTACRTRENGRGAGLPACRAGGLRDRERRRGRPVRRRRVRVDRAAPVRNLGTSAQIEPSTAASARPDGHVRALERPAIPSRRRSAAGSCWPLRRRDREGEPARAGPGAEVVDHAQKPRVVYVTGEFTQSAAAHVRLGPSASVNGRRRASPRSRRDVARRPVRHGRGRRHTCRHLSLFGGLPRESSHARPGHRPRTRRPCRRSARPPCSRTGRRCCGTSPAASVDVAASARTDRPRAVAGTRPRRRRRRRSAPRQVVVAVMTAGRSSTAPRRSPACAETARASSLAG